MAATTAFECCNEALEMQTEWIAPFAMH